MGSSSEPSPHENSATVPPASLTFMSNERELLLRTDLDKMLKMAEDLQEKCDRHAQRMTTLYTTIFGVLMFTGVSAAYTWFKFQNPSDTFPSVYSAMFAVYGVMCGVLMQSMVSRNGRVYYRDRKALFAIVDMLREIEPTVSSTEKFSTLEQAEVRIRLARFDVGPSKKQKEREEEADKGKVGEVPQSLSVFIWQAYRDIFRSCYFVFANAVRAYVNLLRRMF